MSAERPLETDFYLLGRFLRADYLALKDKACYYLTIKLC